MVRSTRIFLHFLIAAFTVGVFLFVGFPLLREAWQAARQRRVVIEQLFLLGMLGAFVASVTSSLTGRGSIYYEVVSILLGIYVFGKLMAAQRQQNVENATFQLAQQFSTCLRILADGKQETVAVEEVQIGDKIAVPPGKSISVDGKILQGSAYVQETSLTGEPFPVIKRPGDPVLAGSEVIDSELIIEATSPGKVRQLDKLLHEILLARSRPSATQREADRIITWFLPIIIFISLLTFFLWQKTVPWSTALFYSMSVLLVACPCAMGLATPIAIWGALNALVRRGWRVKSPEFIERLAHIDTVVFDKTGTLSEESLKLVDLVTIGPYPREKILGWVNLLQGQSLHPVARAFHGSATTPLSADHEVQLNEIETIPATGLRAIVEISAGKTGGVTPTRLRLEVGNHALLSAEDVGASNLLRSQLRSKEVTHDVWIKIDGTLCALAQLRETLRESARRALDKLDQLGIDVQVMTGDTAASAERLGIARAQVSLTPLEKMERVRDLQKAGRRVLFIGDGLNDAAALAEAHASLTPVHAAALAQASSQATMHELNLATVPEAILLSRQTVTGIRRNLLFAAAYNLLGVGLAASGWLHPVAAALLMLAASATVTSRAVYFAENIQLPNAALRRKKTSVQKAEPTLGRISPTRIVVTLGFVLQAILLIYLGQDQGESAISIGALGVVLGLLNFYFWSTVQQFPSLQMASSMLSVGNLGMMAGWWMDAGFSPIIHAGISRSCCLDLSTGNGLHLHLSFMQLGMLLGSFPFMLLIYDPQLRLVRSPLERCLHALLGSLGMLLGMWGAGAIFSLVPILNARLFFHLYYTAMTIGMLLGMFALCGLWRLALPWRRSSDFAPSLTTNRSPLIPL